MEGFFWGSHVGYSSDVQMETGECGRAFFHECLLKAPKGRGGKGAGSAKVSLQWHVLSGQCPSINLTCSVWSCGALHRHKAGCKCCQSESQRLHSFTMKTEATRSLLELNCFPKRVSCLALTCPKCANLLFLGAEVPKVSQVT